MKVRGPDGNIYELPQGTTQDQALAIMRQAFPPDWKPTETGFGTKALGALNAFGQGLNPYNDEMASGIRGIGAAITNPRNAGEAFSNAYNTSQENQRQFRDDFANENPKTDLAMKLAGGVAGAAAPVGASLQAAKGAGTMTKIGVGAGAAGATGGVMGFGEGNNFEDRLSNAGLGAAMGATLGGAFSAAGAAGAKLYDIYQGAIASGDAKSARAALKALDAALQNTDDPRTLEQLDQLRRMSDLPDATLIDVGGAGIAGAADDAATNSRRARETLQPIFEGRRENLVDRAEDRLRAALDAKQGVVGRRDELDARLAHLSDEIYAPLIENADNIPQRAIASFLKKDPDFARAMDRAQEVQNKLLVGKMDRPFDWRAELEANGTLPLGFMLKARNEYGQMTKFSPMNATERSTQNANASQGVYGKLTSRLKQLEPDLIDADARAAGFNRRREALNTTYDNFSKLSPDEFQKMADEVGPEGLREMQLAAADHISTKTLARDNPATVNALIHNRNSREKITTLLGQEKTDALMGGLKTEKDQYDRLSSIMGGSPTQMRQNAAEQFQEGIGEGVAGQLAQGRPIAAASSAIGAVGKKLYGKNSAQTADDARAKLMSILADTTDPLAKKAEIEELAAKMPQADRARIIKMMSQMGAAGGTVSGLYAGGE